MRPVICVVEIDHHVLWLDVLVQDRALVQIFDGRRQLHAVGNQASLNGCFVGRRAQKSGQSSIRVNRTISMRIPSTWRPSNTPRLTWATSR